MGVSDWAAHRSDARVEEFVQLVRDGRVSLSAMPFNLHTDVCSTEELHQLLADARRVRDRYGIEFTTAMQTDVPGQVVGLPDALQEVGVRYLSVAHNWAGRSQPHTSGGIDLPRLFRWRTPAGNEVIVWMTDSPHGLAYMEGPMLGFHDGIERVDEFFPPYLEALATRGYPFPAGVFGAHGEDVEPAEGYPWDVLHLRTHGWVADNAPARARVSEIVREWNDTWESPRLRVSTNDDFFTEAVERYGSDLQTVTGDWGDWWVEGVGSAAQAMAVGRQAQDRVSDGRSTSQVLAWAGGDPVRDEQAQAAAAYDAVTMFDEHTWGASNSWLHGDHGYDSGERQWQWKAAQAHVAGDRADGLVDAALAGVGDAVSRGRGRSRRSWSSSRPRSPARGSSAPSSRSRSSRSTPRSTWSTRGPGRPSRTPSRTR
ncbi:hypothetical protein P9139_06055 [Curtobacterium flaccumfaciens]|nr:hypothetical protein P9139_06055 [Curtobacterium flaccumfaciens]